jgi:hypothetical protein
MKGNVWVSNVGELLKRGNVALNEALYFTVHKNWAAQWNSE